MAYAIWEIIIPLIIALLLGVLLGWFLWRWRRTKVSWSDWETTQQRASLGSSAYTGGDTQVQALAGDQPEGTADLEARVGAMQSRVDRLEGDLKAANGKVGELKADLGSSGARIGELEGDLEARGAKVAELEADVDSGGVRIGELEGELAAATTVAAPQGLLGGDGGGPDGFAIKGNVDSMLYHRPDSRNYGATVAEAWFGSPEMAETAGFTLANTHPKAAADSGGDDSGDGATESGAESDVDMHPHGPGSHAPLADDSMPDGYTIKGNVDSMLYHRPDSRSYRATIAEMWFDTADSAEGSGFTLANTHPKAATSDQGTLDEALHPYGAGSHAPSDDNSMPAGYPIKGNVDSMLYHRTDSRNYGATVAEMWFATADDAEAAGFRLSPTHPKGT